MTVTRIFLIVVLAATIFACGKSEKELAAEKLALAKNLYEMGDTTQALQQVDTIQKKYKGAIQVMVDANQFKKKIYADLLYKKQDEMDSLKVILEELESKFVTEKTEFDRYTQYIHKRQQFKRRWNKSFIQIHLDERGELYISSNYYGDKWLEHTGLRVYDNDIQAKTKKVPLDNVLNHRSDFMDTRWEKVTYREGADNGVIQFIADHVDRNLKAVFLGSRYYYIILEEYDKQAMKDALELSKALKQKTKLEREIQSLQSKVG
ncbi:hypothetical protein [Sunxiuqinia elliptica]|uniref:Lipoprotein n=1 Tax=Sunxiuqinia elliptica TaxID=655355 RepID=A0A4R6H8C5_9BACT|nr:hypothetical protein [Sunxiuqinia elliptica]TDO03775.1 hypothetical protein DET52_102107 [Sunxiuqinia elliptica]TDO62056.1 hypothetical protein DET65_1783 [Sunxiuqinia elliptica]